MASAEAEAASAAEVLPAVFNTKSAGCLNSLRSFMSKKAFIFDEEQYIMRVSVLRSMRRNDHEQYTRHSQQVTRRRL